MVYENQGEFGHTRQKPPQKDGLEQIHSLVPKLGVTPRKKILEAIESAKKKVSAVPQSTFYSNKNENNRE